MLSLDKGEFILVTGELRFSLVQGKLSLVKRKAFILVKEDRPPRQAQGEDTVLDCGVISLSLTN
jgi:hypothetical protein